MQFLSLARECEPTYNEGYIYFGEGDLVAARVVKASWLRHMQSGGEDVGLVLETSRGNVQIEGVSVRGVLLIGAVGHGGAPFPPLLEGIARYRRDGEDGYGMIEHSNIEEKVRLP